MEMDATAMPPLLRAFAEAVRHNPTQQQWLHRHGHALIDALISDGEGFELAILEILRLYPADSNKWAIKLLRLLPSKSARC